MTVSIGRWYDGVHRKMVCRCFLYAKGRTRMNDVWLVLATEPSQGPNKRHVIDCMFHTPMVPGGGGQKRMLNLSGGARRGPQKPWADHAHHGGWSPTLRRWGIPRRIPPMLRWEGGQIMRHYIWRLHGSVKRTFTVVFASTVVFGARLESRLCL